MEPLIKINSLTVLYDKGLPSEVRALENINLQIFPQEFTIIFGPSGCGKSTLLYVLAGIEKNIEETSQVIIKNEDLVKMSKKQLIIFHRQSIGMIFQAFNLVSNLTVEQNVALPLLFAGVNKRERMRKTKVSLARLNISQFAKRLPQRLSGGQQQRIGVARALVNDPEIILADEPTGNLDSENAKNILDMLQKLNKEKNKTIILVTHEAQYLPYGKRIIYFKDGKIIKEETIGQKEYKENAAENKTTADEKAAALAADKPLNKINLEKFFLCFGFNLSAEEKERLSYAINDFFENKISSNDFTYFLDESFKRGGVGLYKSRAKKLGEEIAKIKIIRDSLKLESNQENLSQAVKAVIVWLLEDYKGHSLSQEQDDRIRENILKLVKKQIQAKELLDILDRPLKDGGAGLNFKTARNFILKLEILLDLNENIFIKHN